MFGLNGTHKENWISDEYTNCIPNPKHTPKYAKAKVPHTWDKQHISWAALQSSAATAATL